MKPAFSAQMRPDGFRCLAGHRRQGIGQAGSGRRSSKASFGVWPDQTRHANRGDPERQRMALAQQVDMGVGFELSMQDRGHEQNLV